MLESKRIVGSVAYLGVGSNSESFTWCWGQMIQFCNEWMLAPGHQIAWERGNDNGQADTRNTIAQKFLGDWLVFIDSDHVFEPDLVSRMVSIANENDMDVLAGLYHKKYPPYAPVLYDWDGSRPPGMAYQYAVLPGWKGQSAGVPVAYPVSAAGAGCLFIRRTVFDRIRKELNELPFEPRQVPGMPHKTYSEDFSFFERCRLLTPKVQPYCVPALQAQHLRPAAPVGWSDFDQELVYGDGIVGETELVTTSSKPTEAFPKNSEFVRYQDGTVWGGWMPKEHQQILEKLIKQHGVKSVVEIGSFLGHSAVWFAKRVERVTCVDKWREDETVETNNNLVKTLRELDLPQDFYSSFKANIERQGVSHKIQPIKGDSAYVYEHVPVSDLVYVDGDHSYEGCLTDLSLYGPKALRVICGDDYSASVFPGVIQAVTEKYPNHKSQGTFWWAEI